MSRIYSICYQPAPSEHKPPYRYNRVPVASAELLENHGIKGDRKAGKSITRQLNIMGYELLTAMEKEGYKVQPGQMGEQIIIEGLDVMALKKGERLAFGEQAVIEITKPRTPCDWFELIQGKSPEDATLRVGMLAKVVVGGMIRVGDPVRALSGINAKLEMQNSK